MSTFSQRDPLCPKLQGRTAQYKRDRHIRRSQLPSAAACTGLAVEGRPAWGPPVVLARAAQPAAGLLILYSAYLCVNMRRRLRVTASSLELAAMSRLVAAADLPGGFLLAASRSPA